MSSNLIFEYYLLSVKHIFYELPTRQSRWVFGSHQDKLIALLLARFLSTRKHRLRCVVSHERRQPEIPLSLG
jgi:hypothetical protein